MDLQRTILELQLCREELASKEQMLAMTTRFLLEAQKNLEERNKALGEMNKDILASIRFAQLIQNSLSPDTQIMKAFFRDAAFHISQRDGIGGDSLFSKVVNDGLTWGLLDATGHGIPASLLSVSVIFLLHEIAATFLTSDPIEICTAVNNRLYNTFRNEESSVAHMEGTVFGYFAKENLFTYCSARGKGLLLKRDGTIENLEKENLSIGEYDSRHFTKFYLNPGKGDRLFLYSDGLTDQFGGLSYKKFGRKNLQTILIENLAVNATQLKQVIISAHEAWKKQEAQTDDVSFMIIDF